MSRSTVAALLSALVMPGAGHFYLKRVGRGFALLLPSLLCLWLILDSAMRQASAVVDQIEAEGGLVDPARVSELVAQSSAGAGGTFASLATLALIALWVFGIVDAWRLGKKNEPPR